MFGNIRIPLLFLCVALGYVGSYLFQPGLLRMFVGLSDYLKNVDDVLLGRAVESTAHDEFGNAVIKFRKGIAVTAWVGVGVGFVAAKILAEIPLKEKRGEKP